MTVLNTLAFLDRTGFSMLTGGLSLLWQSSVLMLSAWLLVLLLKRFNASIRHAILTCAIFTIPFLPSITGLFHTAVPTGYSIDVLPSYTPVPYTISNAVPNRPLSDKNPVVSKNVAPLPIESQNSKRPGIAQMVLHHKYAPLPVLYVGIVFFLLGKILTGRRLITKWISESEAVTDDTVMRILASCRTRLGIDRQVMAVSSSRLSAPMVYGSLRPVILLPHTLLDHINEHELRDVLLHELTHIRRNDPLILTALSIVRSFLFFQLLIWIAARELSLLAESACDEEVINCNGNAKSYAELLTRLAGQLPEKTLHPGYTAGFIFSRMSFYRRIKSIIAMSSHGYSRISMWGKTALVSCIAAMICATASFPLSQNRSVSLSANTLEEIIAISEKADSMITSGRGTMNYETGHVDSSGEWGKKYEIERSGNGATMIRIYYINQTFNFVFKGDKYHILIESDDISSVELRGKPLKQYEEYISNGVDSYSRHWDDMYAEIIGEKHADLIDDGKPLMQIDDKLGIGTYDPRSLHEINFLPLTDFLKGKAETSKDTSENTQTKNISKKLENIQLVTEETVNDHRCKVIKGEFVISDQENDYTLKSYIHAWLAEDFMCRPVQIEEISYVNNEPYHKSTSTITYANQDEIWFPQKKEQKVYLFDKNSKEWKYEQRKIWTVHDDFEINAAIPDSLFEYEYR